MHRYIYGLYLPIQPRYPLLCHPRGSRQPGHTCQYPPQSDAQKKRPHLLAIFPMLVSQCRKATLLSSGTVLLLEQLTDRMSCDLGVFVVATARCY